MIDRNSPFYFPLQSLLQTYTIPELRRFADGMSFRFKAGVKKALIVGYLAKLMLEHPDWIVRGAFSFELKAWLDIIEDRVTVDEATASGMLFELNRFGLIYAVKNYGGAKPVAIFQTDMAEKLAPLIKDELRRRESDGTAWVEKMLLGLSNIYGVLDDEDVRWILDNAEKKLGRKFNDELATRMLYPVLCITNLQKGEPFLSMFAAQVGFEAADDQIETDYDWKGFYPDDIIAYGEMPYPRFPGKAAEKLRKLLGPKADGFLRRLWLDHQRGTDGNPLGILRELQMPSLSVLNDVMANTMEFVNNVPCWKFRGHSSEEVARRMMANSKQALPRPAVPTPSAKAPSFAFTGKIGRNDPCPCGSGKKYKNCCGRDA